jgi:FkbH-like protein
MKVFSQLKKNLKQDFSHLKRIKIALLGDTSTQLLNQALRGMGYDYGFNLQLWEADFNQVERQVFDPAAELYVFEPEIVIIFQSSHKLLSKYSKLNPKEYNTLADTELKLIESLFNRINDRLKAKVIYFNYAEIDDAVFGSYACKTDLSFLFQLRKLNYQLMEFAAKTSGFYTLDLSCIQNRLGKPAMFQPAIYINSEMVLSIEVLPVIAGRTLDMIAALNGKFKKCLILDLDNTLWGGIIGDDGLEKIQLGTLGIGKAFTEFQYWIKKLKIRGIILAVCSKNTEAVAKEPFEKHPDMVLNLDDIAVFVANWGNKVDNIRHIQQVLNIGFDSMVFLDDNPFERNMAREGIPELTVPDLPEDPAEYLEYVYTLNLFETVSFSEADAGRTAQYQNQAKAAQVQQSFANEGDFLKSLDMVSLVEPFNPFNTPRVSQLSQRSNQFNLRTVRYTEQDVEALMNSAIHFTFSFTLEDKFGDNGLICIIVLKKESAGKLFIETWLMSCRVLKRGMEAFVLNTMVNFAVSGGFTRLKGEYLPTAKNEMVKDHYKNLGFYEKNEYWLLDVDTYQSKPCFIRQK